MQPLQRHANGDDKFKYLQHCQVLLVGIGLILFHSGTAQGCIADDCIRHPRQLLHEGFQPLPAALVAFECLQTQLLHCYSLAVCCHVTGCL